MRKLIWILCGGVLAAACSNSPTSPSAVGGPVGSSGARISTQSIADTTPIGTVNPPGPQPTCTSGKAVSLKGNPNNGKVDLSWSPLVNTLMYDIQVRRLNGTPALIERRTHGERAVNYSEKWPHDGSWQFRVQGIFAGGCKGPWSDWSEAFTVQPSGPVQNADPGSVSLNPNGVAVE